MSIAPLKLVRLLFRWFLLRGMSGDRDIQDPLRCVVRADTEIEVVLELDKELFPDVAIQVEAKVCANWAEK
jgi:hypothetical protein